MKRLKIAAILVAMFLAVPAFAADLVNMNLRVYNVKPDTSSYWDINKAVRAPGGGVQFPINTFLTTTTGSFAVYLLANYNFNITNKTITANVSWTPGTFKTRSNTCPGAYVRLEFQDVAAGPYDSNDYWWSTVNLDLNAVSEGMLIASLADRALWTNQAGRSALDTTKPWIDWTGAEVLDSPYEGFTKAMKNVKQIGLSLGSSCTYASGVAIESGLGGTFRLQSYKILP